VSRGENQNESKNQQIVKDLLVFYYSFVSSLDSGGDGGAEDSPLSEEDGVLSSLLLGVVSGVEEAGGSSLLDEGIDSSEELDSVDSELSEDGSVVSEEELLL